MASGVRLISIDIFNTFAGFPKGLLSADVWTVSWYGCLDVMFDQVVAFIRLRFLWERCDPGLTVAAEDDVVT